MKKSLLYIFTFVSCFYLTLSIPGFCGEVSLDRLLKMLDSQHPKTREKALRELFLNDKIVQNNNIQKAIPPLIIILKRDQNASNRSLAARALGNIGTKPNRIIPLLLKTLDDPSPEVRSDAVLGLAEFEEHAKKYVPEILKMFDDSSAHVRISTARALGRLGVHQKKAVRNLKDIIESYNNTSNHANIRKLGEEESNNSRNNNNDLIKEAISSLRLFQEEACPILPELIHFVKNGTREIRTKAVIALGNIASGLPHDGQAETNNKSSCNKIEKAVPVLVRIIQEDSELNKRLAVVAVGNIQKRPEMVVPVLIKILKRRHDDSNDNNFMLQSSVARALGQFGDQARKAIPVLKKAKQDSGKSVRIATRTALKKIRK